MTTVTETCTTVDRKRDAMTVTFPGDIRLTFAMEGGDILGIREVLAGGVPLRQARQLWKPAITTSDGIFYHRFKLLEVIESAQAVEVVCEAVGLRTRICEDQDEYLCEVIDLSLGEEVRDRLSWCLAPSEQLHDGQIFRGFSYHYRFTGERQIHRIVDFATWEVGGSIIGNTLLFQGQLNPPVITFAEDTFFTTACNYYGAQMNARQGPADKVSIQRLPRLATIQAFDLLSHPQGILLNTFEPGADIVSIIQKEKGEDVLKVVDEARGALGSVFETPTKHICFLPTPEPWSLTRCKNLWWRILQRIHERERERLGIRKSPVLPRIWTPQVGRDHHQLLGRSGPRQEVLYLLADEMVPRWAASGVREICCPSYWVSDYTVDRFRTKNESGLQGGFTVSGICSVRVHEIDPVFGGPQALAYFVEAAHRHGILVQLWWATHLSRRAPIFQENPGWMIQSRNGHPGCGGIGDDVIIPMDLSNPDCFEWELDKLKVLHEQTGIDGFFHDSYGNYTFLPVNHADPLRRTQQEAYGRLVAELQQAGMTSFTAEGIGPWAVGHFAMRLLPSEPGECRGFQNALDWWMGHEDMMSGLNMGIHAPLWQDEKAAFAFAFRCLAAGGRFGFTQHEADLEYWTGWLRELNCIHAQFGSLDGERQLMDEERGIRWLLPDGEELLFSFSSFENPATGRRVSRLDGDGETIIESTDGWVTTPSTVYRLV